MDQLVLQCDCFYKVILRYIISVWSVRKNLVKVVLTKRVLFHTDKELRLLFSISKQPYFFLTDSLAP